ncbi:MAG: SHOCT domain-containing protein [Coriobacteriia bacterium]|nr:SHOCT domain-containing protein [Coriobacteriia bacterium]
MRSPPLRRVLSRRQTMGLLGTVARTAVISGTAQATANAVNRRQAQKNVDAYANAANQYQAQAQQPAQVSAVPTGGGMAVGVPGGQAGPGEDMISQLERLAALKAQGILTDEEFAAQKARILAG